MITHCPVCNEPLCNAVTFACCLQCCESRLFPKLPRQKKPPKPHKYADLPEATWHGELQVRVTPGKRRAWREQFAIEGRGGEWIRPLFHRPDDERIACRVGNCRVELVRFDEETML